MNQAESQSKPSNGRLFSPSRSLRTRLLVTSITLVLIPVLITGIVAALISSQGLRSEVFNQLESVATLKDSQIQTWLQSLQTNLDLVFITPDSLEAVSTLVTNPDSENATPFQVRNALIEYNQRSGYFTEIFVMDLDGRVSISTNEEQEGKILKTQSFFHNGLLGPNITPPSYELSLQNYSIVVSQPLTNRTGRVIGVLAGRANLNTLNEIMNQRAGLGETGETYVVNSNNAVLTSLRFEEVTIGQTYINTQGVSNVVQQQVNGSGVYEDYRDVTVVGVYHWIPELQIAVLAEQSEAEALASSNRLLQVTFGLIVVTTLVAVLAAYLITQSITSPISKLAQAAQEISRGNLEQNVEVTQRDEIGVLADSFNTMTTQLRNFITTLEQRVADRTKALTYVAEISTAAAAIQNLDEMLESVVHLTQRRFGLYHAHVFLYDEELDALKIMACGWREGDEHEGTHGTTTIPIDQQQSLVARAARTRLPVIVNDVRSDSGWLPNPLLPDTAAELAVPLLIGEKVIGVLDVQSDRINVFTEADAEVQLTLSSQVAVAVQNIRQFENSQKIARDVSAVAQVGIAAATITDIDKLLQEVVNLSKNSFNLYHAHIYLLNETGDTLQLTAGAGEIGRQMVSEGRSIPLDSEKSLVARAARNQEGVIANDVTLDPDFLPHPLLPHTRAELAVPMIVNNRVIGVLDVQSETAGRFTEVDLNVKTTLASQIAVALQNARNFEQSRRQAEREAAVNLITQRIQSATNIESALQVAARELGHALGKRQTIVRLDPSGTGDNGKENQ